MSCECLASSECDEKRPESGDVLSGFVKVTFTNGKGQVITVGNQSAPGLKNHACIKDFEFGHSDGCEARINIHDEQGGDFSVFMTNLLTSLDKADGDLASTMEIQFGWIKTYCEGDIEVNSSPVYYLMARTVDCNFSNGKFMFNISGVDITEVAFETQVSRVYGSESQKIHITEAITKLFTDDSDPKAYPIIKTVDFLTRPRKGQSPKPIEWSLYDRDPKKGPKGTGCWKANNKTKLEVAKEWLSEFTSKDGKAIVPAYDSTVKGGRIVFWEDPKPKCGTSEDGFTLGKYVVNGGLQSNVLEFSPRFKWYFAGMSIPGGSVGAGMPTANSNGGANKGLKDCATLQRGNIPTAGQSSSTSPSAGLSAMVGAAAAATKDAAIAAQQRAYDIFMESIEADMVIIGDPTLIKPQLCIFRNVHIIFINPYYISEDDNLCGEWLAKPQCNPYLSNKNWMVKGIVHRIQDGKFTTTLQLYLAAPGVDVDKGEPLGGSGSGGSGDF